MIKPQNTVRKGGGDGSIGVKLYETGMESERSEGIRSLSLSLSACV